MASEQEKSKPSRPIIGIDLGTSNSAVTHLAAGQTSPKCLGVPQMGSSGDGRVNLDTLPSVLYIPTEGERAASTTKGQDLMPGWTSDYQLGALARSRSSESPERSVVSAKSWLCNRQVDRREAILPWKSEITEKRVSPVEASREILRYLRAAIAQANVTADPQNPEDDLSNSADLVLTVPASFDEGARDLTQVAAKEAGLGQVTLLEEDRKSVV